MSDSRTASPSRAVDPWPTEWMRGALEVCVLAALAPAPTYGYAIATDLEKAGLGQIKGGTLYPLLGRLEAAGLVDVEWQAGESGPGRKYYALNDAGREHLTSRRAHWRRFTDVTRNFIEEGPRR
ncbi:PadR family transcriptional regulator [Austwickia chelonae]|uniref:PadR family transcriptional regulator n=1 Tax=Austwickia chelonae TaxID=100225 RepID=UPI000E274CE2|nr:PadR family transcriptional regulator [Austwickia chelonae]